MGRPDTQAARQVWEAAPSSMGMEGVQVVGGLQGGSGEHKLFSSAHHGKLGDNKVTRLEVGGHKWLASSRLGSP